MVPLWRDRCLVAGEPAVPVTRAVAAAMLAYARGLLQGHRHQRFCGVCGSATGPRHGGHNRVCRDDGCGTLFFPRIEPAIIVLVEDPGAPRWLPPDGGRVKQQIRFCRTRDGVTIAYAVAGSGPPLVKTANWLSHLEHDWRTPIWQPLLARLARGRTLLRYDQRGCGLSDWEVADLSLDAWVADLEAVVDAAGLERFPLLGISQGAAVAIAYAVRHPERVTRLILYGGYARGMNMRDATPRQREEAETLIRLIRIGWGRDNPAYRNVFASLFIPDASLEQMRAFSELQRLSASAEMAERIVTGFESFDVQELARGVRVPTLVLHVRRDARVPFGEGRHLAALIPGAEFVPVEGNNHVLLPGDRAFDRVGDEVDRFLAADGGPPAGAPAITRKLTRREAEVLELVARGLDNAAIAERLFISGKTVRNHITNIFTKLGVTRRPEAIVLAREAGLGRGGRAGD